MLKLKKDNHYQLKVPIIFLVKNGYRDIYIFLMKILNSRVTRDQNPQIFGKNPFFEGGNSMKINFLVKNGYKGTYL